MPFSSKEKAREYRKAHAKERAENLKQWRKENPEKIKGYRKKAAKHPQRLERQMWYNARGRAKEVGLEFNIEVSDIVIPERCPLLPSIVLNRSGEESYKLGHSSPSIDRLDNTKGYIKGNVWVVSWKANNIKNDATPDELELVAFNLRKKLETKGG